MYKSKEDNKLPIISNYESRDSIFEQKRVQINSDKESKLEKVCDDSQSNGQQWRVLPGGYRVTIGLWRSF